MRHWLIAMLLCAFVPGAAWATSFTREEISIMHGAGVRMALVGETKPYVIPEDIIPERLIQTELLDFSGNSVVTVPEWLGKFTQLRKLDLSNAGIKADAALISALGNMPQLEVLNLSGNPLFASGGNLAGVWGKLPGLRELNLAKTGGTISGYGSLVTLTQLLRLDLSGSSLNGNLTELGLKKLPLQQLNLANSGITGSPMPTLPTITLEQLDLSGNSSIRIEEEYGSMFAMPKLAQLKIDDNITLPAGLKQKFERMKESECRAKVAEQSKRHRVNGDGTVTDIKTGLMWKQCSEGQSGSDCEIGEAKKYQYRSDLSIGTFAGYSDWRLPTIEELVTLRNCGNGSLQSGCGLTCDGKVAGEHQRPTINQAVFPNTPAWRYWSSTDTNTIDCLEFSSGYQYPEYFDELKDQKETWWLHIRLVRSGQ